MFCKNISFLDLIIVHSQSTSIGKCLDYDDNSSSNITPEWQSKEERKQKDTMYLQ